MWESARLNSIHGDQLKEDEKKSLARKFYEDGKTEEEIAENLAVSIGLISKWCKDLVEGKKDEQERQIID